MEKSEIFNKAKWNLEHGYITEEKYVSDMSNKSPMFVQALQTSKYCCITYFYECSCLNEI